MRALADVLRRLRSLVLRREFEDRLDDEIRFHVEQQTEKNQRAGMTPDEARRQALIRFGGVEAGARADARRVPRRAPREPRARRPLRPALASPPSGLHCDGRAVAGHRHRRQHGHLRRGVRGAVPPVAARRPRHARQHLRSRERRGVQSDVLPEHRGPAPGHDGGLQRRCRIGFCRRANRSRGHGGHRHGRGRDGGRVRAARRRASARPGHSAPGRRVARRSSGGDAEPRLLAARLRRRPAGGGTHAADGTPRLHHHRRRPGRLPRRPAGGHAGLLRPDGHAERADGHRDARPADSTTACSSRRASLPA